MRNLIKGAIATSLAAVLVTAAVTPGEAAYWRGGGWHGGGWGGGWHGGGWGGWRGGGWGNNNNWGWGVAAGVLGGAVLGSALTSSYSGYGYGYPGYSYGYGYGGYGNNGCVVSRPVYNRWGRVIGRRLVDLCY